MLSNQMYIRGLSRRLCEGFEVQITAERSSSARATRVDSGIVGCGGRSILVPVDGGRVVSGGRGIYLDPGVVEDYNTTPCRECPRSIDINPVRSTTPEV